jgi:hypothetical protein
MILIDLSDLRFQFLPEDNGYESAADFIIDNLTSLNISDVILDGSFKVRNNHPVNSNEELIILNAAETREHLYKAGKYEELKKRKERRENIEKLDMSGRSDDEIKLFSETTAHDEKTAEAKEEFKIKVKIPLVRPKTSPGQRSLFEEIEQSHIVQSIDFQETPELNLLITDVDASKPVEEDIIQTKIVDEAVIKSLTSEKTVVKKQEKTSPESKVELPKNVKLKFGDD